jgi:4-hydroxy-3-methylbut-2-enyl diphosphate reductase
VADPVAPEAISRVDRKKTDKVRKAMYRSDDYYKFSRDGMAHSIEKLKESAGSKLLTKIRLAGFVHREDSLTFVMAQSYGFCWGVERAIAMAHEARRFFPEKRIWCTNEIIHNPVVNDGLEAMGMGFIEQDKASGNKDFSVVNKGDVVLLPAFGASVDEMAFLQEKEAKIVDTTCPWVARVWGAVETAKRKGYTALVHGKSSHEETVATTSFASSYLVMKGISDAEYVCKYIMEGGSRDEFMAKFKGSFSDGFDPDTDLAKVGMANQTTMMKSETMMIGKLFERTMLKKYGPQNLKDHFLTSNTICDATQDRQDAMYQMLGKKARDVDSKLYAVLEEEQQDIEIDLASTKVKEATSSAAMENKMKGPSNPVPDDYSESVDFVLIIGGFNSSNTTHLAEICEEEEVPVYHIDDATRIGGASGLENIIEHKPLITPVSVAMAGEGLEVAKGVMTPGRKMRIGVSSGASTPDNIAEECLQKLLAIKAEVDRQASLEVPHGMEGSCEEALQPSPPSGRAGNMALRELLLG